MKQFKFRSVSMVLSTLVIGSLLTFVPAAGAQTAYDTVDAVADRVMSQIDEFREVHATDPQAFYDAVEEALGDSIDYQRMAFAVMDRDYYLAATPEQRDRFVEVFRRSLLETYAKGLLSVQDERVETVRPEQIDASATSVDVEQLLHTGKGVYSIIYRMRLNDEENWQLINVTLEGINLGRTFRNQFQQAAAKYDGDINAVISNWYVAEDEVTL